MESYFVKASRLSGTSGTEIRKQAELLMRKERARTKRQPYVRSAYFHKDKVFIQPFWQHVWQKNWRDRNRRVKLLPCALELLRHSRIDPLTKENPHDSGELFHRFAGITGLGERFIVQVSEDKRTNRKNFISVFPDGSF
jgi:hypothetical protein